MSDFVLFRTTVLEYYSVHNEWPQNRGKGKIPKELASYLDGKIEWKHPNFTYDWECWIDKNGKPKKPKTGILLGFSVRSDDETLLWMIENVWGSSLPRPRGKSVTFVIQSI